MMKKLGQKQIKIWSFLALSGALVLNMSFNLNDESISGMAISASTSEATIDSVLDFEDGENCTAVTGPSSRTQSIIKKNVKVINEDRKGNKIIATKWHYKAVDYTCDEIDGNTKFKKIVIKSKNKETECAECIEQTILVPVLGGETERTFNKLVKELAFNSDENKRIARIQKRVDNCERKWVRTSEARQKKSNKDDDIVMGGSSSNRVSAYKKGYVDVALNKREKLECKIEKGQYSDERDSDEERYSYFMKEIYPDLEAALLSPSKEERNTALEIMMGMQGEFPSSIDTALKSMIRYTHYKNGTESLRDKIFERITEISSDSQLSENVKKLYINQEKLTYGAELQSLQQLAGQEFMGRNQRIRATSPIAKSVKDIIRSWGSQINKDLTFEIKNSTNFNSSNINENSATKSWFEKVIGNDAYSDIISLTEQSKTWDGSTKDWCTLNEFQRNICKNGGFARTLN